MDSPAGTKTRWSVAQSSEPLTSPISLGRPLSCQPEPPLLLMATPPRPPPEVQKTVWGSSMWPPSRVGPARILLESI